MQIARDYKLGLENIPCNVTGRRDRAPNVWMQAEKLSSVETQCPSRNRFSMKIGCDEMS